MVLDAYRRRSKPDRVRQRPGFRRQPIFGVCPIVLPTCWTGAREPQSQEGIAQTVNGIGEAERCPAAKATSAERRTMPARRLECGDEQIQPTKVSVLVPAFNEEANVQRCYDAIVDAFRKLPGHDYEIIFTDNHSTDATFEHTEGVSRATDSRVQVIRFSRNIGYQRSVLGRLQSRDRRLLRSDRLRPAGSAAPHSRRCSICGGRATRSSTASAGR